MRWWNLQMMSNRSRYVKLLKLAECVRRSEKRNWKKITRRIRHNSLSKAKSALLYRQLHLPVSCDLRCYPWFGKISIRELSEIRDFVQGNGFPCGTGAYPWSLWVNTSDTNIWGERKREIGIVEVSQMKEKTCQTRCGTIHYWASVSNPDTITLVLLPGLTADHRLLISRFSISRQV